MLINSIYPDHSIRAHRHQLSIFEGKRLDHPGVAVPPLLTTDLHLDGTAIPQQQVAPAWARQHLTGRDQEWQGSEVTTCSLESDRWFLRPKHIWDWKFDLENNSWQNQCHQKVHPVAVLELSVVSHNLYQWEKGNLNITGLTRHFWSRLKHRNQSLYRHALSPQDESWCLSMAIFRSTFQLWFMTKLLQN